MFSKGQLIFAAFFVVAFILLMILSYQKDAKNHQLFYKGTAKKVGFWMFIIIGTFLLFRFHGAIRTFVFGI